MTKKLKTVILLKENSDVIVFDGEGIISYKIPSSLISNSDGINRIIDFYIKISKDAKVLNKDYFGFGVLDINTTKEAFDSLLLGKSVCKVSFDYEDELFETYVPCGTRIRDLVLGEDSYRLDDEGNLVIHVTYNSFALGRYFKSRLFICENSKENNPFIS